VPYKKFEQKQLRTLQQCPTVVPNIYSPTDTVFIKVRRGREGALSKLKKGIRVCAVRMCHDSDDEEGFHTTS
jgi:hypothetical protein